MAMFNLQGGYPTMFTFPKGRMLRIESCAMEEDLVNPVEFNSKGQPCLIVGKVSNTTNLTVGCCAGLKSFVHSMLGFKCTGLAIYSLDVKNVEAFCTPGDSGSLIWHMKSGKAYIISQISSGTTNTNLTSIHVVTHAHSLGLIPVRLRRYKDRIKYT